MPSQPGIISKITNSCQTECTEFCQAQDKIRNRLEDKIYALKLNNIPNSIYIIFNLYLRKGCEQDSILGSDCIDSYFVALSALWVLSECSLIAHWLLTFSWLIAWRFEPEWWRLTALDNFVTDRQTDGQTDTQSDSLGSCREPKTAKET